MQKAKEELLAQTDIPDAKQAGASKALAALETESGALLAIAKDGNLVKQLRSDKQFTLAFLQENHEVEPAMVEALYRYGKAAYQLGKYAEAAEALGAFRSLTNVKDLALSAGWGKLAAEILAGNWDVALEE